MNNIVINSNRSARHLAILGGEPVISREMQLREVDESDQLTDDIIVGSRRGIPITKGMVDSVVETTKSGIWCRIQSPNGTVPTFEKKWAEMVGRKYCVCTGAGTQALSAAVEAMGIGPGDEVITSPYTDIGTISAVLFSRALVVLADLDPESFQLDPEDVERRINGNTKAIIPVHIGGQPAHMERIMAIAKKHNLRVIEDACQAHFTEYQGKQLGTIGDLGCFSFQAGKNIGCGEGGAIVGDDEELMDACFTIQNRGTNRKGKAVRIGPKYRMNEFEAALLLPQLENARDVFNYRNKNAWYMNSLLRQFPGVAPQKLYDGTGACSWWVFLTQYKKEHFNNVPRDKFLQALRAEGVSGAGYIADGFHRTDVITNHILDLDIYKNMYSPARLKQYRDELPLPNCDRVTDEINISFGTVQMASGKDHLDKIFDAIVKVYENRDQLSSM